MEAEAAKLCPMWGSKRKRASTDANKLVELSRMCLVCNPRKVDTASALARMTIVNDNAGTVGGGAGYHLENAGRCVG